VRTPAVACRNRSKYARCARIAAFVGIFDRSVGRRNLMNCNHISSVEAGAFLLFWLHGWCVLLGAGETCMDLSAKGHKYAVFEFTTNAFVGKKSGLGRE
jgi:hypothetical protein